MRNYLMIFLIPFLLGNYCFAQENEVLTFSHGPYLQNVSETGATICFNTNRLVVPGVMIKSGNNDFELKVSSTDGLVNVGNHIHKVRIENLKPGQLYEYKLVAKEIEEYYPYIVVFGDTLISKSYSFKTFSTTQKQVNFTVFCDIHDQATKLAKYLDSNAIEKQDCYFLNGDILGHIEEEAQVYSSFLDTCIRKFASEKPFYYARGNHETRGKFARQLKNYLDLPDNKYYYGLTIANTRFVILDGGEDKPDTTTVYAGLADFDNYRLKELEWLKKEVVSEEFVNAQFKIVIVHMPIKQDKKNWYGMAFLAEHFGPVLKESKIDLMISGHTHKNAWIKSNDSGFGYPVMISSNNNYIEAQVNKSEISIQLKDLDGKIVDEYVVGKR
ncbi:MAG: metallophosphoesterase [Bacteroidetes bacterium]|nr:metallophosphoesterase [Bacteroidota bacterium]